MTLGELIEQQFQNLFVSQLNLTVWQYIVMSSFYCLFINLKILSGNLKLFSFASLGSRVLVMVQLLNAILALVANQQKRRHPIIYMFSSTQLYQVRHCRLK